MSGEAFPGAEQWSNPVGASASADRADVESLARLFSACPLGLVSFGDDGRIRRANPEAANLLATDLGSVGVDDVVRALAPVWPALSDLMTSSSTLGTVVDDHRILIGAPQTGRWLSATLVHVADDEWLMVLSDASARVAGELAVLDGDRRLRTVFDSIDEGFCVCEIITDHHGSPVDYRFLEVNPLFSEMTGLIDPVGRTARELVPDLEQVWIDTYGRAALQGEKIRFEQASEAMGRWFDVFAMPIEPLGHFAVVFKDQTQRRRAEEATSVAAAEATFRARLTDALRSLDDPLAIKATTARVLGEYLDADRVHYAEIEASGKYGIVRAEHRAEGMSSVIGRHRLDEYGPRLMDEFRAGHIVSVDDLETDERLDDAHRLAARALGIGALIMVPIVRDGRVRSAMMVHSREQRSWTDGERAIVDESAERTLAAVDRARSNQALRIRHQRSDAVSALIAALEEATTHDEQAELVVEAMIGFLGDYASLEAPGNDEPILALGHRDADLTVVLQRLREQGLDAHAPHSMGRAAAGENQLVSPITPSLITELAPSPQVAELLGRLAPRSHMAVPVSLGGRRQGALMVGITDPTRDLFVYDDLLFLRETADRIGVVLTATALRRQEHHVAIRLQQALLPDEILWHPHVVIEARYAAATADLEVGGDWYDTYRWDDGRIGLMVGDVAGHNLESAAAMGRLRSAAAAFAPQSAASPAALLDALDGFARGRHGTDFATAACFTVDPANGVLVYSSAGHPPALVLSPDGTCSLLEGALSPPLCAGVVVGARTEASVMLQPNSLIVVYTDGLVERRHQSLDVGIAELQRAVIDVGHERLDKVADAVLSRMQILPFEDDVVVACFRYTPASDRFEHRFPADPRQLAGLRDRLRRWFDSRALDVSAIGDALLTISEAATNAVEHAYRHRQVGHVGEIIIEVTDHDHHLTVNVRDHGRWQFTPAHAPSGGRGLNIIRTIADRYQRISGPEGTTVTMIIPTAERLSPAERHGQR